LYGNPFSRSTEARESNDTTKTDIMQSDAKNASEDEPVTPPAEPKFATHEIDAPAVPTFETPNDDQVKDAPAAKKSEEIDAAKPEVSVAETKDEVDKKPSEGANVAKESPSEIATAESPKQPSHTSTANKPEKNSPAEEPTTSDAAKVDADEGKKSSSEVELSQGSNAEKSSSSEVDLSKNSAEPKPDSSQEKPAVDLGNDDGDEAKPSLETLPQDKPIIDPATYHRKFCMPLKKQKLNPMMLADSTYGGNMNMSNPMDRMSRMMMMDNEMNRMHSASGGPSGNFNPMMMEKMRMMAMMGGGMGGGMSDKMKMMAMMDNNMNFGGMGMNNNFSPNDPMMMSPTARRMALGMGGGMNFNDPMMNMMGNMGDRDRQMMPPGRTPGNLQELRDMMGRDTFMGNAMFNRMGSHGGFSKDGSDFNRMGSKGSNTMFNHLASKGSEDNAKNDGPSIANELLNRLGSKGSAAAAADPAKNEDQEVHTDLERRGSAGTGKGSRGSPSLAGEDYMRQPLLPTPAEIKPSLKKAYKDISFSPLDRLDRGLMKRMMAFENSNDPSMGPMADMPRLPNNTSKRKYPDYAYSPRSPNPKKSFLERHRMMDLEMKGQLEEAMSNFSRFQRKYSGGSGLGNTTNMMGGNDPSMLGAAGINQSSMLDAPGNTFAATGAPLNIPTKRMSEKTTASKKSKKKSKHAKKVKSKAKKAQTKASSGKDDDPRKPKRPFSAYNIFFQVRAPLCNVLSLLLRAAKTHISA
jgi:hypothetical protein